MLIDPRELQTNTARLEEIEKASLRLVAQAVYDYREAAALIFREESDWVADIGEDITREALDRLGMSIIDQRLFGKIDYKRARYVFHPQYAIKQALFVDSKAEKVTGQGTATLQTSQTSMVIQHVRAGKEVQVCGSLPCTITVGNDVYVTTTIFVKYNYTKRDKQTCLETITIAALPNGFLQAIYNPSAQDSIWIAGRNAPSLGEAFRVRLSFSRLRRKARWRVQTIPMCPAQFQWSE